MDVHWCCWQWLLPHQRDEKAQHSAHQQCSVHEPATPSDASSATAAQQDPASTGPGSADAPTLEALHDDAFRELIAACSAASEGVPLLEEVMGLQCSKALLLQLHRLRPLVGVRSLAFMRGPAHAQGPWRFALLYAERPGRPTNQSCLELWALRELLLQGRVHSITSTRRCFLDALSQSTEGKRLFPQLLGKACSLRELDLSSLRPLKAFPYAQSTEVRTGGALCSKHLRRLRLTHCQLPGPMPELRLPALQELQLFDNQLTGDLGPLRGCVALQTLDVAFNHELSGCLKPLWGCTALRVLHIENTQLAPSSDDRDRFKSCLAFSYSFAEERRLESEAAKKAGEAAKAAEAYAAAKKVQAEAEDLLRQSLGPLYMWTIAEMEIAGQARAVAEAKYTRALSLKEQAEAEALRVKCVQGLREAEAQARGEVEDEWGWFSL